MDLSKKKKIKTMNSKMTTNSQLSTTEPKKSKNEVSKQTGAGSQKWSLLEGLSAGRGRGQNRGKDTGNKKHKWQVQNQQGEFKNSMGNRNAKELICTTHGHELWWGNDGRRWHTGWRGIKGRKNGTTVIA